MSNGGSRKSFGRASLSAIAAGAAACVSGAAHAEDVYGPINGHIGLVTAGSKVAADIHNFNNLLLIIMAAVTALVLVLLLYVMLRYNRAANPVPRKFTHNIAVEVVWTVVPVIILVVISVFSFPLLFEQERTPKADITIKATGNTWNWSYSYPDHGLEFVSNPLQEEDAKAQNRVYRQAVDEPVYVPVNTIVRVLITSNDVIHAWSVPSLGVKEDAVPGRVNETWFKIDKPGIYYGFCQELCGLNHSFMPIEVRGVTQAQFEEWVKSHGGQLAQAPAAAPAAAPPAPAAEPAAAPAAAPAGQPG